MTQKVEMGKVYFNLDGTTETKEKLNDFFISHGFKRVDEKPLGSEMYKRVSRFTNEKKLEFDVIWFINLCHVRFGDWESGYIENIFTSIEGSYVPDVGHMTFDFKDNGKTTLRISIPMTEGEE